MHSPVVFPRFFRLALLIVLFPFSALEIRAETAQSAPPPPPTPVGTNIDASLFDVSVGFDYLHVSDALAKSMYGFDVSLFVNANSWLALGGEFLSGWGRESHKIFFQNVDVDESRAVYVGGARIKIWRRDNFKIFGEALAGGAHGHVSAVIFGNHVSSSADGFAAVVGGGADWKFSRRLSWRVIEADYIPAHFNSQWENELRVSTGLSYAFGSEW